MVLAAADGTAYIFYDRGPNSFGNHVNIDHGNGYFTVYGHLKNILVSNEQSVKQGHVIGIEGTTGFSTGDHIHFGLHTGDPQSDAINSTSVLIERLIAKEATANNFDVLNGNQFICALPGGHYYKSNNVQLNSLARIQGQDPVYWLQNAKAYHVLSFALIDDMSALPGWGRDKIYTYPSDVLEIYPAGSLPIADAFEKCQDFITTGPESNGLLIRAQGDVYLIENGEKRHITSAEVFVQRGYDWNDVIDVTQTVLNSFNEGIPISPNVSQAGVIDFEEFRARTLGGLGGLQEIGNFYSGVGVSFTGATSLSKADGTLNWTQFPPHSGDALIFDTIGGTGQISISFTVPVTSVGGYYTYNNQLTFEALDVNGVVVQTKKSSYPFNYVITGNPPNEYIELNYMGGIKSIRVKDSGNTYTLDDLTIKNVLTNTVSSLPGTYGQKYQDLDTLNQGQAKWKQFLNNAVQTIRIILGWGGSSLSIRVYRPDGSFYNEYQSSTPPIEIDIPGAEQGTWKFEITPENIPYDNYPFALVIGVTVKISGGAYFYPENSIYRASFSMDVVGPSSPSGWLKYYYTRTRMNFVSTRITSVTMSGSTATISGTGTVNGAAGYTFMAIVDNGTPDNFSIVIRKSDGSTYYSAGPKNINGGDLEIR